MNIKTPPAEVLKRYLSNACTEEERRMVDAWYEQLDQEEEGVAYSFDEQVLRERIRERIGEEQQHVRRPVVSWRSWWLGAAAASVILVLGLAYWYSRLGISLPTPQPADVASWEEHTNAQKKIERFTLPDQSVVWLHPGARVSYWPAMATATRREVRFSGEGFFEVARDTLHPFVIYSGPLKTQVLGTSFNVKAYEQEAVYHVSVVTGSVAVSTPAAGKTETLVLKPNQQVTYQSNTNDLSLTTIDQKQVKKESWQPVSLVFDDTPLSEVVVRLQKTFRVEIGLASEALGRCRIKVDFNSQRLPEILEMINALLGTTYEMEGEKIRISGEGCTL